MWRRIGWTARTVDVPHNAYVYYPVCLKIYLTLGVELRVARSVCVCVCVLRSAGWWWLVACLVIFYIIFKYQNASCVSMCKTIMYPMMDILKWRWKSNCCPIIIIPVVNILLFGKLIELTITLCANGFFLVNFPLNTYNNYLISMWYYTMRGIICIQIKCDQ